MKITHLQSSTQIVDLGKIKVLTDPWLTPGETHGSWYHYPPFEETKFSSLEYDYIYVTHIHPDHLSENTFRKLPRKKPVLLHNYESKFVKSKIERLGFEVIECNNGKPYTFEDGTSVTIYAADNCDPELCARFMGCGKLEKTYGSSQIDTLAVFKSKSHTLVNVNDCPFELAETTIKKNNLCEQQIDLLLVGYAGAGPYPQCFEFDDVNEKIAAAKLKERQFLDQALKFINLLKPKKFAPFAGTYILGSRLSKLNDFRGMPSIQDALKFLTEKVGEVSEGVLLEQQDQFNIETGNIKKSKKTFNKSYDEYVSEISKNPLEYDADNWDDDELAELMDASYERFKNKANEIGFVSDTKIILETGKVAYQFDRKTAPKIISTGSNHDLPFVKISLDHNLLHRLVRGPQFSHWNNAEGTSHLIFQRKPEIFERSLYHAMCFFHR